jgi:hypothetical protein
MPVTPFLKVAPSPVGGCSRCAIGKRPSLGLVSYPAESAIFGARVDMASLQDKIKVALDESRMLILGSQVLLGFQYRAVMEPGFAKLSLGSQYLKLFALVLMLIVMALLMAPGSYHRIVADGDDREDVHDFATAVMDQALLPFSVALGIELYVAAGRLLGRASSIAVGLGGMLAALFFWYGLELISERRRKTRGKQAMKSKDEEEDEGPTPLRVKIDQVLTEIRVVLPGAQALLGFQFAAMLIDGFDKLPLSSKYVHLIALGLLALSIIFMMAPAAYHRIVEDGEDTEDIQLFAGRMLLSAMVLLALGVSGDLFVVVRKITDSSRVAVIAGTVSLLFFYGLWFGYTFYCRAQQRQAA